MNELKIRRNLNFVYGALIALWIKVIIRASHFLSRFQEYSFEELFYFLTILMLPVGIILLIRKKKLGWYLCCYWLIYYLFVFFATVLAVLSHMYYMRGGEFISVNWNYEGPNIWSEIFLFLLAAGALVYLNLSTVRKYFAVALIWQRIVLFGSVILFGILYYDYFYHHFSGAEFDLIDSVNEENNSNRTEDSLNAIRALDSFNRLNQTEPVPGLER